MSSGIVIYTLISTKACGEMFRSFDRLQDGSNKYPDGTVIEPLLPLPDREAPPTYDEAGLGFPNFVAGKPGQRSPLPPWINKAVPEGLDYRPPSELEEKRLWALQSDEREWINRTPIPGWMFNSFRLPETGERFPGSEVPARFERDDIIGLTVETQRFMYNEHCWHDPEGHLFRPDEPRISSDTPPPNVRNKRGTHDFRHASCGAGGGHHGALPAEQGEGDGYSSDYKPLFVRANHGDVVTLELENRLPRAFCQGPFDEALPACERYTIQGVNPNDGYHDSDPNWKADITPPMQCGLHVHLVKFDPLVCDGAATGWNYLSGPRAPYWDEDEKQWRYLRMRYIWWVDEEFGVIFTHDHLFANFRQKRGLFGAMIAEPYEATWHDPEDLTLERRFGDEAVISAPGDTFREFCIGLGDFVPLYNRHHQPLNEPPIPGGHSDHGVVGINYRSEPIRERTLSAHGHGNHNADKRRKDPAYCFSSHAWGDPATPIFRSRPGDPIRLRLVQGSHEEQHSFQVHGMRWRRFRDDPRSPLKNQQTLGISEAFTFKIEHGYGEGDYLYKFGTSDDLWMGAWGLIRVGDNAVAPLPQKAMNHGRTCIPSGEAPVRRFHVVAEWQRLQYCVSPDLADPKGLVYRLVRAESPDGESGNVAPLILEGNVQEPLILRCRAGEWVELKLTNKTPRHPKPEPNAPMVPVEMLDRPVSERVSIHADLLAYDVRDADGCNVGWNPLDQTAAIEESVTYRWYAHPDLHGPVLLQDFADFRNHRHHGLIGTLIVESEGASVVESSLPAETGSQALVRSPEGEFHEIVVIIQDGLRLFHFGNLSLPMGDPPADPGEAGPDPTDQGQKAFNYRAQPIGEPHWMNNPSPATPVFTLPPHAELRLHLVTAADKPRNHSFTVHGHLWKEWPTICSPTYVGSATSLSSGTVDTLRIQFAGVEGDYAYRSGALRWAVSQGLWGIIRVQSSPSSGMHNT